MQKQDISTVNYNGHKIIISEKKCEKVGVKQGKHKQVRMWMDGWMNGWMRVP